MVSLRRYRRYLSYPIIVTSLLFATPSVQGHFLSDRLLNSAGALLAFLGQALRLWAWAISRPASRLRINGPYAFIKHPLYVGNYLIALGLLIIFNAPVAYLIVLPSLALLYWRIATEEEIELARKFGDAYGKYRARVSRFLPLQARVLKGDRAIPFDWRRAVSKEQESICGLVGGAIGLEFYEEVLTGGFQKAQNEMQYYLISSLLLGLLSLGLSARKRRAKG